MIRGEPGDFEALMQRAGLTIDETAELIGRSPRTVRRYMTDDDVSVPRLVVRTLANAADQRCAGSMDRHDVFSFIDLFAGIGGLRRPFEELGGKCLFTSEWDRFSRETYAANFPETADSDHQSVGDIRP